MAQQLTSAETVRAEEIALSVPDGRSVTTLVSATPIRSADGAVESMVLTMHDLGPLDELELRRAEFLSMVSHELRTPLIAPQDRRFYRGRSRQHERRNTGSPAPAEGRDRSGKRGAFRREGSAGGM